MGPVRVAMTTDDDPDAPRPGPVLLHPRLLLGVQPCEDPTPWTGIAWTDVTQPRSASAGAVPLSTAAATQDLRRCEEAAALPCPRDWRREWFVPPRYAARRGEQGRCVSGVRGCGCERGRGPPIRGQ